jgi:hypothetical protein
MGALDLSLNRLISVFLIAALSVGLISQPVLEGQESELLTLVSQVNLREIQTEFGSTNLTTFRIQDVWGEGTLAVVNAERLLHLIDFSNLESPQIGTIRLTEPGEIESDFADTNSWDAKIQNEILYVGLQDSPVNASLLIYDIKDITAPRLIGALKSPNFVGVHNLFVKGSIVFLASVVENENGGQRSGPVYLVDVSVPELPFEIGAILDPATEEPIDRVHDVSVVGGRAYLAGTINGFWIVDLFDLDESSEFRYEVLLHHTYTPLPSARNQNDIFTHNVWPSKSGEIIWTTDEQDGEGVRAFDVSDPNNIELLGVFSLGRNTTPHNVLVDGDLAYVSYYRQGLRILQVDDEAGIIEVGSFDTSGGFPRGGLFSGNWGVYPFGDFVLASDTPGILSIYTKNSE